MKFLVVGLGSMGKRRVRCLQALGHGQVFGFDPRADRAEEASAKYGIKTFSDDAALNFKNYDAILICTPPDKHEQYLKKTVLAKKPAFIEASVLLEGLDEISNAAKKDQVFLAPSTTLRFHPVVKDIREIVKTARYGKVTNFSYFSGQYLPDWHPWEDIKDFYVSKKETGGAREIVPFEMTWMTEIFGFPSEVQGVFGKTLELGVDIDDTYALNLKYKNFIGQLMVDVVARFAQRRLIINLEQAQITWDWNDGGFKVYEANNLRHITYEQPSSAATAALGYNKNIIEQMYIDEISAFIAGIDEPSSYPNTIDNDIEVLKVLYRAEKNL